MRIAEAKRRGLWLSVTASVVAASRPPTTSNNSRILDSVLRRTLRYGDRLACAATGLLGRHSNPAWQFYTAPFETASTVQRSRLSLYCPPGKFTLLPERQREIVGFLQIFRKSISNKDSCHSPKINLFSLCPHRNAECILFLFFNILCLA